MDAAPYLVFALRPALALAVTIVVLASIGYSATLLLQQRLMALTPGELSGHALGLHSSGMLAMQGIGAALAGAVAQRTSPPTAMAVLAAASVAVTLALAPGLRPQAGLRPGQRPQAGLRPGQRQRRDLGQDSGRGDEDRRPFRQIWRSALIVPAEVPGLPEGKGP